MKRNKITFIVFAVIFLLFSLAVDMRNAVSNGQIYILKGIFSIRYASTFRYRVLSLHF